MGKSWLTGNVPRPLLMHNDILHGMKREKSFKYLNAAETLKT
jgi:hypothetical protein